MTRVADLTMEELKAMIESVVEERLEPERRLRKDFDKRRSNRTLQEVFESVERNRLTPPPGSKSPLELLREDRER